MNLQAKPFFLDDEQQKWVADTLGGMNDRQKAGQLFCVLGDLYSESRLLQMVERDCIGGVLLRPCDIDSLIKRNDDFDRVAKIPILKAANLEEGGDGAIADGNRFGCQMQIAAMGDVKWASRLGEECAREAEFAGINLTFSPDADIDINFRNPITNTRTYGSDPEVVREFSAAYMKSVQSLGIAACAKHFPGDGVDYRDQHLHPTVNSLSTVIWDQTYGKVYSSLINDGVLCIMAAHIMQPSYCKFFNPTIKDEDMLPASLSKELMESLLREKLGFNGLIMIDGTIMGGFCQSMKRSEAIPHSIEAGGDMLIFNTDFEEDMGFVLDGLKSGALSRRRFEDAVTRVLALKAHLRLYSPPRDRRSKKAIPISDWMKKCAERSVTLIKNKEKLLPIAAGSLKKARIIILGSNLIDSRGTLLSELLIEEFKKRGVEAFLFDPASAQMRGVSQLEPGQIDIYAANCEARSDQTTVRLFWNGKFALDLPRFIKDVPSLFISFSNPYHLQDVPGIKTYINAYTPTPSVVKAVVAKLFGEQKFTGVSPVDAFCGLLDTQL